MKPDFDNDMKYIFERHVHDHEVLISFNDDEGAMLFSEWWTFDGGEETYKKWCEENWQEYVT